MFDFIVFFCAGAAASDEHSHMNIIIVAIAVICAVMVALILLFIMRRVIVHRQDTKHQRSKGAARLMLNPEEVREKRALKLFAKGFHSTRKASEGIFLADTKRLLFKVEQIKNGACCELQAVFLFSTVFLK